MALSFSRFAAKLIAGTVVIASMATAAHADATLDRIKGRGKLTVGVILSGAPFGFIDPKTQEQKGLNIDVAKALAAGLGVELVTETVTPPNRVQFLQQGKVDILIANMQYTEERAKTLDYVPTPMTARRRSHRSKGLGHQGLAGPEGQDCLRIAGLQLHPAADRAIWRAGKGVAEPAGIAARAEGRQLRCLSARQRHAEPDASGPRR